MLTNTLPLTILTMTMPFSFAFVSPIEFVNRLFFTTLSANFCIHTEIIPSTVSVCKDGAETRCSYLLSYRGKIMFYYVQNLYMLLLNLSYLFNAFSYKNISSLLIDSSFRLNLFDSGYNSSLFPEFLLR